MAVSRRRSTAPISLLYAGSDDLVASGTQLGGFVANNDGGYYPVDILGSDGSWISLGSISASLVDNDGSETLVVAISAIPVGASLTDGTHTFTATAGSTSIDVTAWDMSNIQFKAEIGFSGIVNLMVTATATEAANGVSASSSGVLEVVVADADAPILYVPETMVVVAQGTGSTSLASRTVDFPISVALADSSETLTLKVLGLPTGAILSDGTHTFTASMADNAVDISSWDRSSLSITLASGYTSSGTSITVTATSTVYEIVDGVNTPLDSVSSSQVVTLISDYTTTTATGTTSNNSLTGNSADNHIDGGAGNDTISGLAGNDLLLGGSGTDNISGGDGSDVIYGGSGTDTITGGAGSDRIVGGAGNDTLTGGAGGSDLATDVFQWELADRGTTASPAADVITDFNAASAVTGGDILDLRDLLVGESASNLSNYLHFEVAGGSTTISVSTSGAYAGGFAAGRADQTITLSGVDLTAGNTLNDQAIIQDLLTKGKLVTD